MVKPKKLKVKAFRLNPLTCLNERRISDFPLSISTDNVVSLKSASLDNKSLNKEDLSWLFNEII